MIQILKEGIEKHSNINIKLNKDEVEQYCKENKGILQFSTYGGRFVWLLPNPSIRTYKAFTVEDDEIRKACREALHTNENWKRNINSY